MLKSHTNGRGKLRPQRICWEESRCTSGTERIQQADFGVVRGEYEWLTADDRPP